MTVSTDTVTQRPSTTVVLAMSVDGKISDRLRSHPRFGSSHDFDHLEQQVALADAVLFGATTLKAGGTAMRVLNPDRIAARVAAGKPEQPIQIVCTRTGDLDPSLPFFQQPIPRYLLTSAAGARKWQTQPGFDQVLAPDTENQDPLDWQQAFATLYSQGVRHIAVLGGGEIVAALLEEDLLDELQLTLCPVLLGGTDTPSPVAGQGFLQEHAPRLELVNFRPIENELFLHYRVHHRTAAT